MSGIDNLLSVENLKVVYTARREIVHAVNGISFELKRGETLGIVGETGAGKSTTAYSIMRVLPERTSKVLKGEIKFEGRNLLEVPEAMMRHGIRGEKISMIFQDPMSALKLLRH